ncbi:MAG TPA: DegT/DnrJ/EryC1/StrS family aminotransferase [Planctomycetota bacterium]|nr:DegT/DnrJ/EryC1/StrS family aminotransferase [Planctomycetota bacterium]
MANKKIAWWTPEITGEEAALIKEVLDANYLNDGDVTTRFEQTVAKLVGAKHGIAVTSGTSALFLSLVGVGVGAGDEVIVPDITFIATANAVTMAGAKPVLVDIDPNTLNADPAAIKKAITPKTKAIMPVHVSGRGANMNEILKIGAAHGIPVIEDAAEAFMSVATGGSKKFLGTLGKAGCLSFSPNKTITTGQGGMIFTDDDQLHVRLRELKDQGRPVKGTGGDDFHNVVGYNFKFTNLQAAVGLGQLSRLTQRVERQRRTYKLYAENLAGVKGLRLPGFEVGIGETPQWVDAVVERRDELDKFLIERNVHCRRFWFPIHTQKPYKLSDAQFPVSSRVGPKCIWLPTPFNITDAEVLQVCGYIKEFLNA